jgi:hypothetical protein
MDIVPLKRHPILEGFNHLDPVLATWREILRWNYDIFKNVISRSVTFMENLHDDRMLPYFGSETPIFPSAILAHKYLK